MAPGLNPVVEMALLARLMAAIGPWLRTPLTAEECHRRAREGRVDRVGAFLRVVEQGVFSVPRSPYRRLLDHAGIGMADLRILIEQEGLEGTLGILHGAGVYLSLDEFKGRRPITRGSLVIEARSRDFDNPLSARHFMSETGGSRSRGTRIYIDLGHYERDATYDYLFAEAFGLTERPRGAWRPTPPYGAGIKAHLGLAKLGIRDVRWFSQTPLRLRSAAWRHALLTEAILVGSRLAGRPVRRPEHVPLAEAWKVAAWLAECRAQGHPALLNTNASSGVRVARAALEKGLDISGSFFRLGGEPFTRAKEEVLVRAGVRAVCHYTMGESGRIGVACAAGTEIDDVHILEDKIALIQRPRSRSEGEAVPVNVYTTLQPTTPKLMLNVESDDFGTLVRRSCGCLFDRLGHDLHLSGIRSWEKLTSEGMNFLGSDLLRLIEEVLPSRFGGTPIDYQFLEEEEEGLPKVTLLVSPAVGTINEAELSDTVLEFLDRASGSGAMYSDRWREGETLRIRRREPIATRASKVMALHTTSRPTERS